MCLARFPFHAAIWLLIFNFGYTESGVISGPYPYVKCAIHCEYPCQSLPPSSPSAPIYGGQLQPPLPDPSCELPPPPPSRPLYGVPPPPIGPSYGVTPPPYSQLPGGNYPSPPYLQCCTYSPPSTYSDTPYGSAAHLCLPLFSRLASVLPLVIVY